MRAHHRAHRAEHISLSLYQCRTGKILTGWEIDFLKITLHFPAQTEGTHSKSLFLH